MLVEEYPDKISWSRHWAYPIHSSHPTNIKSLPWLFLRPSLYTKLQWCCSSHNLTRGARLREEPIQAKTYHHRHPHLSPAPTSVSSSAPTSAQVTMFSLFPSVNPPCSVLCSSKFQCLYFKFFVQVLCFDFVCVSMFFFNFSKHWWVL